MSQVPKPLQERNPKQYEEMQRRYDALARSLNNKNLTKEEIINIRIDMAAIHTIKEYGHIIERLSKE